MNSKKGSFYIIIATVIMFLVIFGIIFLISRVSIEKEQGAVIEEKNLINCTAIPDCNDNNECTIDSCEYKKCLNREVLLCYNNDGCCPKNCNPRNDNDCL